MLPQCECWVQLLQFITQGQLEELVHVQCRHINLEWAEVSVQNQSVWRADWKGRLYTLFQAFLLHLISGSGKGFARCSVSELSYHSVLLTTVEEAILDSREPYFLIFLSQPSPSLSFN